jgi:glycerol kinase
MILAVDQGTSSTKAVLVDAQGAIVARGAAPIGAAYPQPGWVEQDAEEIWASVLDAVGRCLAAAPDARPTALALTNQRESAVVWQRATGAPAGPVIGWQDRRTAEACERLREDEPLIRSRTGLALDPMFSATKLRWLLDRAPAGDLCAGTIDAYLIHRLTGGEVFAVEAGNASRTLLLNLREVAWDDELLALFDIPAGILPEVRRSDGGFGTTVAAGALPAGLPIAAVLADSHAALYGHGAVTPGAGKATYGTGTSVMTPSAEPVEDSGGVSQTVAWVTDAPTWAFEGNIIASGAALDWMAATLGVQGGAELERLAAQADSPEGVHFVPAFSGLGAPYWDRGAQALIDGMTLGTRPPHLARAAIEAVAHQVCDVLEAIDAPLETLHADGGASASDLVMQTQADLCGRPVVAGTTAEMSALGVARMAGAGSAGAESRTFEPKITEAERNERRAAWAAAVARARPAARVEALR